jgi:DNA-binding PadR family transcriptional regulator
MFRQFEHRCGGRIGHRHIGAGRGFGGSFGGGSFGGGSFGGGFRGGGRGMRTARMLASGDLQLIVLLLLAEKSRHGYEIIKAVEEQSCGVYTPSPGMVYPALTYLEETDYAAAASEGTRKLYSITAAGSAHLSEHRATAEEVWNQLAAIGRKLAQFQRQYAEDEDAADRFGSGSGADAKNPDAKSPDANNQLRQMKHEFRALRDELKAALYEKINSSMEEKRRILDILRRAIGEIRGR